MMAGSAMNRRIAVRAALKAGVLGVFIGMIPLLGIVLTGALAVYFYRRESKFVLPVALGARLGEQRESSSLPSTLCSPF